MKKHFFKNLFLGAFALVGMIGISSCSDKDDPGSSNPKFNKETKEVNTSFVFSVGTGKQADTRQTQANVQKTGFLGLDDAIMLAYATGKSTPTVTATEAAAAAAKRYDFTGALLSTSDVDGTATGKSHKIIEMALPINTDAMLFYGKAHKTGTDAQQGKITYTTSGNQADAFTFGLTNIASTPADVTNAANALATILNEIIGSEDTATSTTWKTCGDNLLTTPPTAQTEMMDKLGKAYNDITTIKTGEYRAGSTAAILGIVNDLYAAVYRPIMDTSVNATTEAVAQAIATDIYNNIKAYFTEDTSSTTKRFTGVKAVPTGSTATVAQLTDFPASFGLPYGTALLTITKAATGDSFASTTTSDLLDKTGTTTSIATYKFPAELMYYANSGLRTSNTDKVESEFPNGYGNWVDDSKWTGDWSSTNSKVTANTRAAALQDNINYGTALLETIVTLTSNAQTSMYDNRNGILGEVNTVVDPSGLELVGILVGGQPKEVGWDYQPTSSAGTSAVVYDKDLNPGTNGYVLSTTNPTASNYTMLLDNNNSATQEAQVLVALEFKNNGPGFYGRDNFIRQDGTFYLVGKLTLANGTGSTVDHIFVKDYVTKATFYMDDTSLQKAYVTVPDLRSGQLTFGLSVDIQWETGLTFDNIILGTN